MLLDALSNLCRRFMHVRMDRNVELARDVTTRRSVWSLTVYGA